VEWAAELTKAAACVERLDGEHAGAFVPKLPDADSRAHASRAASPLPPPQVDGGRIRA
jgi:hypothetical protein